MAEQTGIEWADATVNFWHGCLKVSSGCKYCYMYRDKAQHGQDGRIVTRAGKALWRDPYKWKEHKRIFTCSWSDFFIKDADAWRDDAWQVIRDNPQHTWMILTKRPERIKQCLPADWGDGWDNVWIGVSVETQRDAKVRINRLFQVGNIIKTRFISAEPLLGPVDLSPFLKIDITPDEKKEENKKYINPIHWVIVGGESGNYTGDWLFRPCEKDWLHKIVKDCKQTNVPVFVKQLGTHLKVQLELKDRHGRDINEKGYPLYLKPREFPDKERKFISQELPEIEETEVK